MKPLVLGCLSALGLAFSGIAGVGCGSDNAKARSVDPTLAAMGKDIFRMDTFGDETFWTDTLQHERGHPGGRRPDDRAVGRAQGRRRSAAGRGGRRRHGRFDQPDQPGDDDRAAEAERGRRRQGDRRERRRYRHAHARRHHLRALPLHRRQFVHDGDRQAARRVGQPRPESGRDHRAVAGADRRAEGGLHARGARGSTTRATTRTARTDRR